MISLVPVGKDQIGRLAEMASAIWHEYFPCILTEEQIDYMVDKFQSERAVTDQIENGGYRYFFITYWGNRIGYTALKPEQKTLFISKVYLSVEYRGKGLGTLAVKEIFRLYSDEGFHSAYLTVNKLNAKAIKTYERNGFTKVREQKADIGNGFYMDDYVMEKVF